MKRMRHILLALVLACAACGPRSTSGALDGGTADAAPDPCPRGCMPLGPDYETACTPFDVSTGRPVLDSGVDCAACRPSCLPGFTDIYYAPDDCVHPEDGCWRCLPVGGWRPERGTVCGTP